MSYYGSSNRRPSYYGSSRPPPGYRGSSRRNNSSTYPTFPGYEESNDYLPSQPYDSSYESRGRSPPRGESRSSHRDVSPLGSSKYERPYNTPRRNPSYRRGASREPLSGYEAPPYSRDEFSIDSRYDDVQARVGTSAFYCRDPYERQPPPRPGYSERLEQRRRDPVSERRPSGPYGIDISSMAGSYDADVSGLYSGSPSSRRPSDGPDFSRGFGFGYGFDPGMDGIVPPPRRYQYPPPAMGNYYGGGTSGSLGGSRRRSSRGYR